VRAINIVRRHLSRVHGGGLARAASARPVGTSIVSDVIGGAPHDVGSGPGSPDPTTIEDARRVLAQYAPAFRDLRLAETLKPEDSAAAQITSMIVLEPSVFADEVAQELKEAGYTPRVLAPSTSDVEQLASEYRAQARLLQPGEAVIRTAEPSVEVSVSHPGSGGRSTHLAALVARDLPPGVEFMAAASDGVDGSSKTAGAIVDARSFRKHRDALEAAIAAFDTGSLHRAYGTALPAGPTGHNFADVHVLVRAKAYAGRGESD
jgi:hydroxypyruvate reductase